MTINLQSQHLQAIRTHGERAYPNECCGLILGRSGTDGSGKSEKESIEVWATENTWHHHSPQTPPFDGASAQPLTQKRRYTIAPEEMLAAGRHARERHLSIIGIYHSHPNHPAIPSECDRELAWSEYSYIIVSVEGGNAGDLRSWKLDDDRQFQPEEIRIFPGAS